MPLHPGAPLLLIHRNTNRAPAQQDVCKENWRSLLPIPAILQAAALIRFCIIKLHQNPCLKCRFPGELYGGGSRACVEVPELTAGCRTRPEIQGSGR